MTIKNIFIQQSYNVLLLYEVHIFINNLPIYFCTSSWSYCIPFANNYAGDIINLGVVVCECSANFISQLWNMKKLLWVPPKKQYSDPGFFSMPGYTNRLNAPPIFPHFFSMLTGCTTAIDRYNVCNGCIASD